MASQSDETAAVLRLFQKHVPEIVSGAIEIRGIAREPGNRTLVAVESKAPAVDAVGACTGNRGSRVKAMLAELPGEHMDIVIWSDSLEKFLSNLLSPNRPLRLSLDQTHRRATITFPPDLPASCVNLQEIHLRLASRLVGWGLKVSPPHAN
jgi:N utilization substance protein A